ncbi:MAG: FeoA family protein [Pseudomonadota bacterium]
MEKLRLNQLPLGGRAIVKSVGGDSPETASLATKLREIGFAEGDHVALLHRGPFGGRTLAIGLNAAMVALRDLEASVIEVQPI